jgi:D-3-phosphoglycerate dehydrogenase
MVVNAPHANLLSNAEQTLALLLAMARHIPQAHAELSQGSWRRKPYEGIELSGKTLGIAGFGNLGPLIAQRAHAFGMRLLAWDRFVSAERLNRVGVQKVSLDELMAESDFLSIALPKITGGPNPTVGLFDKELLAKAKPGMRIVNTARGALVDEAALAEAIQEGRIAGAAFDTFETEPGEGGTLASPLLGVDGVIVTPHLGASTPEAQDRAGITIAEQIVLALAGDFVPFALNVAAAEVAEDLRPFLPLAERLGALYGALIDDLPAVLEVSYEGAIADHDTGILKLAVLKGLLGASTEEPVSYVNAPGIAEARGVDVRETKTTTSQEYVNLMSVRGGDHAIAGTFGLRGDPRLVMVDDHAVDMPPVAHMVVVRNDDRPGVIGRVGTVLGERGINISDMDVGRSTTSATAMMVLAVDEPVPAAVLDELRGQPGVLAVHAMNLRQ